MGVTRISYYVDALSFKVHEEPYRSVIELHRDFIQLRRPPNPWMVTVHFERISVDAHETTRARATGLLTGRIDGPCLPR